MDLVQTDDAEIYFPELAVPLNDGLNVEKIIKSVEVPYERTDTDVISFFAFCNEHDLNLAGRYVYAAYKRTILNAAKRLCPSPNESVWSDWKDLKFSTQLARQNKLLPEKLNADDIIDAYIVVKSITDPRVRKRAMAHIRVMSTRI